MDEFDDINKKLRKLKHYNYQLLYYEWINHYLNEMITKEQARKYLIGEFIQFYKAKLN